MGRLLLIDGDAARTVALAAVLGSAQHEVELAGSVLLGTRSARASRPDLVIIEAPLPDGTSADACAALRREPLTSRTLALVIAASASEAERIAAFEAGADDCIARPFSTRELLLRVRALLRRVAGRLPPDVIAIGPVRIDRGSRRVSVEGVSVALTQREFDLLIRLADGRGRVLDRETIIRDVWAGEAPSERVVDTTLKRVRRKLPALAPLIRTIRGTGYELMTDDADAR